MKKLLSLALLLSAISVYALHTADDALDCSDQTSKATVIDQEDLQIEKCKCGCNSSCSSCSKCSSCCRCRSTGLLSQDGDSQMETEKCKGCCGGCSSGCCGSSCKSGCCGCRSSVVASLEEDLTANICPCKARCKSCKARCKSCTCDATTCKRSVSVDESCICLDGTPRACECEDASLCKQDCSCCTKSDSAEIAAVLCACEQKRSEDIDSTEKGESQE